MFKKVYIGCDHGGFALKETVLKQVETLGIAAVDMGTNSASSCDYPIFAKKVSEAVLADEDSCGILICGTGLGMSMTANRFKNIRAAVVTNGYMARMARAHNDANILCLGERVIGPGLAAEIVSIFLSTPFEGDRHLRRIKIIDD